jgi:hypothetical protein
MLGFWVASLKTFAENECAIFHPNSVERSDESALRAAPIAANIQPGQATESP